MKKNLQFFMLAVLLAASSFATAQVMRQTTASAGMLLTRKDVQDDLKLSKDVRDKIQKHWDQLLSDSGAEKREGGYIIRGGGASTVNLSEELAKKAMPLLSAAQKTRLEQIRIQLGGPRIAMDAAVKSKIGLTADQEAKMKKLTDAEQEEVGDIVRNSGGRIDQSMMSEIQGIKKKTDAAIDKLLTKTQKDKLKELGGTPFKPVK